MPAVVTRGSTTFQSVTFSSNIVEEGSPALPLVYAAPNATVALQAATFEKNDGRDDLGQGSAEDVVRLLIIHHPDPCNRIFCKQRLQTQGAN